MRRIFRGFCRNWFLMSHTTFRAVPILASKSRRYSDSKKGHLAITNTGSRRLRVSVMRDSPTPRITDNQSWRLPESLLRREGYWIKKNSLYRWYRESSTPRTSDTVSRWFPVSLSWKVVNSAYHQFGEWTTPHIKFNILFRFLHIIYIQI